MKYSYIQGQSAQAVLFYFVIIIDMSVMETVIYRLDYMSSEFDDEDEPPDLEQQAQLAVPFSCPSDTAARFARCIPNLYYWYET